MPLLTPGAYWSCVLLLLAAHAALLWWLHRRRWRRRVARDRAWLRAAGVDPGPHPRTPAWWRLVALDALDDDGRADEHALRG
ncbi:hypothetical protein [Kineococcus sp. SYSU DK004]|uniref:hypothetical protein n=1 Tax=Kineococcus sp. SYSU DK004 TaxID=3383125 RepID=UPI003D7C88AB